MFYFLLEVLYFLDGCEVLTYMIVFICVGVCGGFQASTVNCVKLGESRRGKGSLSFFSVDLFPVVKHDRVSCLILRTFDSVVVIFNVSRHGSSS